MGEAVEPPATGFRDIHEDLLELFLLRVRTPFCLVRAAATCKLWRRVIAGAGFLDRSRSLHGPRRFLLGHYAVNATQTTEGGIINTEFVPSTTPRRPAAASHLRERVSLDFLVRPDDGPFTERVLTDSRPSCAIHGPGSIGRFIFLRHDMYAVHAIVETTGMTAWVPSFSTPPATTMASPPPC
ncbi:hypothetical protein BAE44_0023281 [Dichanthelium oligosanthes]|uniref:F-box domain-containing protein n=1 Tax=Dichanthelium oligosanthes TaxID=888268 RepID=A0A1E5US29_9POAL|nr:hypothetical protein BAE44_0023281 [Dichanthelium oligosanthes]